MKNAPNLPIHCEKFLAKTYKLSLEELGALFRLMMVTWSNKCQALPDDPDEMARSLTCTKDRWLKKLRPRLEPMFDLSEGTWKMTGLMSPMDMDQQWNWVQNNIRVKAENGSKGGRPPAQKVERDLGNLSAETAKQFDETQAAKSLENMETAKPVGFDSVNLNESTATATVTEESKKEPPLSPPKGETGRLDLGDEPPLIPVQEVQMAPSRKRGQKTIYPQEIAETIAAFKEAYPRRDAPHAWSPACDKIAAALRSGVPAEDLIRAARNYAKYVENKGWTNTEKVADARTWTNQKRWDEFKDFVPPKTHNGYHSNVTPLRNGTNGHQMPKVTRGGMQF